MVRKNKIYFYSVLIGIVLLDVIVKQLIVHYKPDLEVLPFFNLIFVMNTGAIFGILGGLRYFFIVISIVVIYLIIKYFNELNKSKFSYYATAVLLAGIIGNLIDRIFRSGVVDYLDFHLFGYHWPAFNIADSAIVVGVILLIISLSRQSK